MTFCFRTETAVAEGTGGRRRKGVLAALSFVNGPFPFNNPLLVVIPSEAEGPAVSLSSATEAEKENRRSLASLKDDKGKVVVDR